MTQEFAPLDIPDLNLRVAAEWTSVVTDDMTLDGLLTACADEPAVPSEAREAMEDLLVVPISRLSGHTVTPLGELIEVLLSGANDPDLLAARECSRVRPTLEELGAERGITRERVRQKVADDVQTVRNLLTSDRFRAVRWATERLNAELGSALPANCHVIEPWVRRLGERRFEILRWAAGYLYVAGWLVRGRSARSDLVRALDDVVGDKWLVRAEDLFDALANVARPEAVVALLLESGAWRDIGEGWFVRWDGPLHVKAERVLELVGRPMTPAELVESIGHGSERSLKNQRGSLVRIDKQFRLALPEWGYEEYEGIAVEIDQRIERGGGVASISAIITEFVRDFGVREGSVYAYLEAGPYVVSGDDVRHLVNRSYTPSSIVGRLDAIRIGEAWGQRLTVSENNLRGYSFDLDRDIAAHNGLQPEDSLRVPALHADTVVGEASLIWRLTNLNGTVDVGRLSNALNQLGLIAGDEIVIVATPELCRILRLDELPRDPRTPLRADVRRSILGRR